MTPCIPGKGFRNLYLNCHTYYSLRYGTLSIEELVAWAQEQGIETLALTDINSTSACYDFVRLCYEVGIDPVIGMEFRQGDELLYVALAHNETGFGEINAFYSDYVLRKQSFPELPPRWSHVSVIYPWARRDRGSLGENEYLGINRAEVPHIFRSRYRHRQEKLVVLQPLTCMDKRGHNLHRLLRAIDHNVLLSALPASVVETDIHTGQSPEALVKAFQDFPQILRNTEDLLGRCRFSFDFQKNRTQQTFTGGKYEDMLLLEKLVYDGLKQRLWFTKPRGS